MDEDFSFDPYAAQQSAPVRANPPVGAQPVSEVPGNFASNAAVNEESNIDDIWADQARRVQEREAQAAADAAVAQAFQEVELSPIRAAPAAPVVAVPANIVEPERRVEFRPPFQPAPAQAHAIGGFGVQYPNPAKDETFFGCGEDCDECCGCSLCDSCCGCRGFYCFESWIYFFKLVLQSVALTMAIILVVEVVVNPEPFHDVKNSWEHAPILDIQIHPADFTDVYCPMGFEPYRTIGYDGYMSRSKKYHSYQQTLFYNWKNARFCINHGSYSLIKDRPSSIDGVCPRDFFGDPMIMCNGMCFEGTQCPIKDVSFQASPTLPVGSTPGDGYTWLHENVYYTLTSTRIPETPARGETPLLGFSAAVASYDPPIKCFGEPEDGPFRHNQICDKPDPQYVLLDMYNYEFINNVRLFYTENNSRANEYYRPPVVARDKVGLFQRPEQSYLDTCPSTRVEITKLDSAGQIIRGVAIALVVMIGIEYLFFLTIVPIAWTTNCSNSSNCFFRTLNGYQFLNISGLVLSLVILIYAVVLRNGITPLVSGLCFENDFESLIAHYSDIVDKFFMITLIVFISKLVMVLYDSLYCCAWKPDDCC